MLNTRSHLLWMFSAMLLMLWAAPMSADMHEMEAKEAVEEVSSMPEEKAEEAMEEASDELDDSEDAAEKMDEAPKEDCSKAKED